jgi:integrase
MFNHARKAHRGLPNPFSEINFYAENNEQTRVLTFQEESLYLNGASQPLRDIATLMLQTGMRPEEVYRIQRQNVHLDQNYLYNPFGKTKAARRKVRLASAAKQVLTARLSESKSEYLFPCETDPNRPAARRFTVPAVRLAAHVGDPRCHVRNRFGHSLLLCSDTAGFRWF